MLSSWFHRHLLVLVYVSLFFCLFFSLSRSIFCRCYDKMMLIRKRIKSQQIFFFISFTTTLGRRWENNGSKWHLWSHFNKLYTCKSVYQRYQRERWLEHRNITTNTIYHSTYNCTMRCDNRYCRKCSDMSRSDQVWYLFIFSFIWVRNLIATMVLCVAHK